MRLSLLLDIILDSVFPPRDTERIVRELNEESVALLLSPAAIGTVHPAATALTVFRQLPMRALVHEAKYRGNTRAQRLLGALLAEYLRDFAAEEAALRASDVRIVLVPIPLSKTRRAERGFNQCEEIARYALARLARNDTSDAFALETSLLKRPKDTEHQTRLGRILRRVNLAGAFATSRPADAHTIYMVVDDVLTTGATLQAAADALAAAGARRILPLALAH